MSMAQTKSQKEVDAAEFRPRLHVGTITPVVFSKPPGFAGLRALRLRAQAKAAASTVLITVFLGAIIALAWMVAPGWDSLGMWSVEPIAMAGLSTVVAFYLLNLNSRRTPKEPRRRLE